MLLMLLRQAEHGVRVLVRRLSRRRLGRCAGLLSCRQSRPQGLDLGALRLQLQLKLTQLPIGGGFALPPLRHQAMGVVLVGG